MPTYQYQPTLFYSPQRRRVRGEDNKYNFSLRSQRLRGETGCRFCKNGFEIRQHMSDEALTKCPSCGVPVRRIISICHINTRYSEKSVLSDQNLKKHGFTKLVKEDRGKYRKIV